MGRRGVPRMKHANEEADAAERFGCGRSSAATRAARRGGAAREAVLALRESVARCAITGEKLSVTKVCFFVLSRQLFCYFPCTSGSLMQLHYRYVMPCGWMCAREGEGEPRAAWHGQPRCAALDT